MWVSLLNLFNTIVRTEMPYLHSMPLNNLGITLLPFCIESLLKALENLIQSKICDILVREQLKSLSDIILVTVCSIRKSKCSFAKNMILLEMTSWQLVKILYKINKYKILNY